MRATMDLASLKPLAAITLADVAARAETTVQTVLRQFDSRQGLFHAVTEFARAQVVSERETTPGDVPRALQILLDHYEQRGDGVMLLLAQESWDPLAAEITDVGRREHRDWLEKVFGPLLTHRSPVERTERIDLLLIATDVYAWKLLRRDRRLDRAEAESRMLDLVYRILKEA